jgi:uncharacterized membrane protein
MPSSFLARRLEVLSDTIFGVAMTMPIYGLPLPSHNVEARAWYSTLQPLLRPITILGCSFLFSGIFWFSHHRRLSLTNAKSRRYLFVTFMFLFLVVLLPVPTMLYSRDATTPWIAVLYSGYFTLVACVNQALWLATIWAAPTRPWRMAIGPGILTVVFVFATAVSIVSPIGGAIMWIAAVLAPIADARATGGSL